MPASSNLIPPGKGYIRGFDGLRAIAVLMVISNHLDTAGGKYFNITDGVMIFFVMSGFLITGILLNDVHRSIVRFFARRVLRLYPALILYLGAVVIFGRFGWSNAIPMAVIAGFAYFTNFVPTRILARETSHLWSLGVEEEQFYLVWPFVVVISHLRRLTLPLAVIGVAASWALSVWPIDDPTRHVERMFIPAADSILMGCIVALIVCSSIGISHKVVAFRGVLAVAVACYLAPRWLTIPIVSARMSEVAVSYVQRLGVVVLILWVCSQQASRLVSPASGMGPL